MAFQNAPSACSPRRQPTVAHRFTPADVPSPCDPQRPNPLQPFGSRFWLKRKRVCSGRVSGGFGGFGGFAHLAEQHPPANFGNRSLSVRGQGEVVLGLVLVMARRATTASKFLSRCALCVASCGGSVWLRKYGHGFWGGLETLRKCPMPPAPCVRLMSVTD